MQQTKRKPVPGVSQIDFQDRGGPSQQPHTWEQQSTSSNVPHQPSHLRCQTDVQNPDPVHLADELHHSPRSSNNSTAVTTSSSTNNSLSHLRHDPGAGHRTVLHDINSRFLPVGFLILLVVALTAVGVITFESTPHPLPRYGTAVFIIFLVSFLFIWGVFSLLEYCMKRRQAGQLWGVKSKDLEKALKENENLESVKEIQSEGAPITFNFASKSRSILDFIKSIFSRLLHCRIETKIATGKEDEDAAQREKRRDLRLSSTQIAGFGAGRYYQEAIEKQRKVRKKAKQREREIRQQQRRISFDLADQDTSRRTNRGGVEGIWKWIPKKERRRLGDVQETPGAPISEIGDEPIYVYEMSNNATSSYMSGGLVEGRKFFHYKEPRLYALRKGRSIDCFDPEQRVVFSRIRHKIIKKSIPQQDSEALKVSPSSRSQPRNQPLFPGLTSSLSSPSDEHSTTSSSSGIEALEKCYQERNQSARKPVSSLEGMGLGKAKPIPDDDSTSSIWWRASPKSPSIPGPLPAATVPKVDGKSKEKTKEMSNKAAPPAFNNVIWGDKTQFSASKAGKPIPVSRIRFNELEISHPQFSIQEAKGEFDFNSRLRQMSNASTPTRTQTRALEPQITTLNSSSSEERATDPSTADDTSISIPVEGKILSQSEENEERGGKREMIDDNYSFSISPTTLLHRS